MSISLVFAISKTQLKIEKLMARRENPSKQKIKLYHYCAL